MPRLGYKSAIWAIADRIRRLIWKILQRVVRYIEYREHGSPQEQRRRAQRMVRQLRKLGYQISEPPPSPRVCFRRSGPKLILRETTARPLSEQYQG